MGRLPTVADEAEYKGLDPAGNVLGLREGPVPAAG